MDTTISSNSPLQDQDKRNNFTAGLQRPIKGLFYILIVSSLILLISIIQGPKVVNDGDADDHVLIRLYLSLKAMLPKHLEQHLEDVKVLDEKAKAYPWSNEMLSWQRTSYHFQPQKNWMNDPNGPLFHMGWYHFFYQYGPNSAVWGNITWGHAVSKDLINWFHLPIALIPDRWFDSDGVWTGSATILPDGQIIMLYTGGAADGTQLQNLAYPVKLSDPLLLEWVKYPGNPVMVPPPGIKEYRDPSTAWLGPDAKWRITIGSLVNNTGISLVYKTTDFKTFELLDGLLHEIPDTGMWECIDLYPVSLTTTHGLDTSANGPGIKHVLKVSMAVGMEDYYAIGTYDPINDKWTPDDPKADVGIGPKVDDGKFYASKTFYDTNKKRRINWAWVPESDSESSDLLKGWASLQTIPRTVVFDTKTRTNLLQWPVEEVESLRLESYVLDNLKLKPGLVLPLNIGSSTQLDIVATFEIDNEAFQSTVEASTDYKCSTSGGAVSRGTLGPFGILVLADESLSELTPIYFYTSKGPNGSAKTHFCADQSRSSAASDVAKPIYGSEVPVLHDEKLSMRILVIAVNGKFPGPVINITTNYDVTLNVNNRLDENLLMTWPGVHMRHTSWQDGVLGTNCPIQSGLNWTYSFQVKDQIGSFFYFPSLNFQRASGGFGAFIITHRSVVTLPFRDPDGDVVILIGDWYKRDHKALRAALDSGKELGMPDGVLINGKGPYRYNSTLVPKGISYETINVYPGRTYRVHVHNVGISTCLNFRIQNHKLLLVETEGFYALQRTYTSLDIHVGQSYSFLVTMDQNAKNDYYIVASARFVNQSLGQRVTGVALLHYSKSKQKAAGPLPNPPHEAFDKSFGLNQALSIRQDVSANGARPNPQGSFHYGSIKVTDVYILKSMPLVMINGKLRATLNGISFINPGVPIRLADKYNVKEAYKLDFPSRPQSRSPQMHTSLLNATYKGFVEIILVNNDTTVQSFHLDGYSFFVVGMAYGEWTPSSRNSYNKWDAIFRCTTQVFPGGWTAILVYLDNVGAWNLRAANLDRWYLGQETYMRVVNPEPDPRNKTEVPTPDNVLYCGALNYLQKPPKTTFTTAISSSNGCSKLFLLFLPAFSALIPGLL